jgi:hypothetical protein
MEQQHDSRNDTGPLQPRCPGRHGPRYVVPLEQVNLLDLQEEAVSIFQH